MRIYPKLKVAAVQASPVYMNMDASVEKACGLIKEAADRGAKLVVFPEAYLPGYPYWVWMDDPISVMPFTQMLYTQALECPGPELTKIATCAKENKIYVNISANERDNSTVYCTQFIFDDNGNMLGKHRKIKPFTSERMIWGEADASTLQVFDTPIGKLGTLISGEHMFTPEIQALCAQMEEIHMASYAALPAEPIGYRTYDPNLSMALNYVISNACYYIMSTDVITQEMLDLLCSEHPEYANYLPTAEGDHLGGGNAFIMSPDAIIISDKLDEKEEGIVTADIDLAIIGVKNFFMDTSNHYCNPAVKFEIDVTPRKAVQFVGKQIDCSVAYTDMPEETIEI